jgi:hypothetical protein
VVAVTEEIGENSIGSTSGTAEALHTLVGRLLAVVRD